MFGLGASGIYKRKKLFYPPKFKESFLSVRAISSQAVFKQQSTNTGSPWCQRMALNLGKCFEWVRARYKLEHRWQELKPTEKCILLWNLSSVLLFYKMQVIWVNV